MSRPRLFPLLALAAMLHAVPARADCELLYAPAQIRARLLAFHYANEQRRAQERAAYKPPSPPPPTPAARPTRATGTPAAFGSEAAPIHRHPL